MEKLFLKSPKFLIALGLINLVGCGPAAVDNIQGLDSYNVVSGSFEENSDSSITGTGTLRFTANLPGISSSRALSLKATLDDSSLQSSVTAMFYSSNQNITANDGIAVIFTRSGATVTGEVRINGSSANIVDSRLYYYYPSSLDVVIEVDNSSTKSRVLIWRRDVGAYLPSIADVDTSRSGDLNTSLPTQTGSGLFAGLIVRYSTIKAAQLSLPKSQ